MSQEQQTLLQQKITFHGAGAMAEAIVRGLISRLVVRSQDITMLNRSNLKRQEELRTRYAVHTGTAAQSLDLLASSPVIVLCMKPKDAAAALRELGPLLSPDQLIVSVIAGLSIRTMQTLLGRKQPIARTMPNTSSTIGLGATGLAFSAEISDEQRSTVMTLFEAVGIVTIVPEDKLEVLTGISGSGPAYVYYLMEAMIAAGIRGGLSSQQSRDLTVQTVLGAARMVQSTGMEPMKLRSDVTSPGGATQAALKTLDEGDFFENVIAAVNRCAERSREMGAALEGELKHE